MINGRRGLMGSEVSDVARESGIVRLRAALLGDPSVLVRTNAAVSLGKLAVDAAAAVPDLEQAALQDFSIGVRLEAAAALGRIGFPAECCIPTLQKLVAEDRTKLYGRTVKGVAEEAIKLIEQSVKDERYRAKIPPPRPKSPALESNPGSNFSRQVSLASSGSPSAKSRRDSKRQSRRAARLSQRVTSPMSETNEASFSFSLDDQAEAGATKDDQPEAGAMTGNAPDAAAAAETSTAAA